MGFLGKKKGFAEAKEVKEGKSKAKKENVDWDEIAKKVEEDEEETEEEVEEAEDEVEEEAEEPTETKLEGKELTEDIVKKILANHESRILNSEKRLEKTEAFLFRGVA